MVYVTLPTLDRPTIDTRRLIRRSLVVFGLMTAGIAAPVLDLYGRNPAVFVANRSTPTQIVIFALLVTFVPPLLAVLILTVTEKMGGRAADMAYLTLVGIASTATGMAISRQVVPESTIWALALGLGFALLVVLVCRRVEQGLALFSLLGPAVLVMFFLISPTSRLLAEPEGPAASTDHVGEPAPIVFIQLDELPLASLMDEDGQINSSLFPHFARLAAEGNWYRNALSNSIATTSSVPAMLTGRLGDPDSSPALVDHPENLFTLLGEGYDMHVVEWLTDLCPQDLCKDFAGRGPARFGNLLADVGVVYGHLSLPISARANLPSIDGSWKGFLGQADTQTIAPVDVDGLQVPKAGVRSGWIDSMERVIDGIEEGASPTIHFAHLEAPHIPWRINPSGTHYQRPEQYDEVDGVEVGGTWVDRPDLPRLGFQRHLYQLGFLDDRLGALFRRLEDTGTWDEALIIVVADHGASFVPGQHRRWPKEDNRADLYRVPLFVKLPGQTMGQVIDEPAFGIDIVPTIVDVLDIETEWQFDGRSLLTIEGTDRTHETIYYCCNDEPAETDIAELFRQVERNYEWVPDQGSWTAVAGAGPAAGLVGSDVDELDPYQSPDLRWALTQADDLAEVSRATGWVPTYISGRLELPHDVESDDLLVAMNGVVAGTGLVTRDSTRSGEIHALVAEDLVAEGENSVQILVPDGSGGWLSGSTADLTVEYFTEEGRRLEIRPEGNRRIEITGVKQTDGGGWQITGWAADVSNKVPADRIYVYAGDLLVVSSEPNKDNQNVTRWFKSDDLLRSGFTYEIEPGSIPAGLQRFTVVAEFGEVAVESPATMTG
ncbi:MAG TPA: sulfatase-like hydrolase/transferase [Acidimicrobiia bacterium]|nr:sulfatase-like hydrolase/transferase [Acidimicrobiia bacterium]